MKWLLEFGSVFDWITPTVGFIQDFVNDPTLLQTNSYTFFVSFDEASKAGWDLRQIRGLLDRHGIKTWGSQITGGDIFFSVKLDQMQWAEYILLRYGIPLSE